MRKPHPFGTFLRIHPNGCGWLPSVSGCPRPPRPWDRIDDAGRTLAGHTDVVSTGRRERLAGERAYATVAGEVFDGADLSSVWLDRLRLERCSLVAADLRQATLSSTLAAPTV